MNREPFNVSIRKLRGGVRTLTGDTPASYSAPSAFGRFQVLHQIGAGVLGPVLLARDAERRSVAIKVFRLDVTPEQAAELAAQLTRLATVNLAHPSIVAPVAAGVEGSVAYFVQEYVGADSLDAAVRQYGPAPLPQAVRILASVAGALDFAAAAGVHHGALHPRDLLVTPDELRITGLGVGRALESVGLRAPVRRPYTAPERVQRESWDARADVYSLGVLAHEMLMGRQKAGEPGETRLPDAVAARVNAILTRATAARPAERFATALDLVAAIQDALAARTSAAVPAAPAVEAESAAPVRAETPLARRFAAADLLLPLGDEAETGSEAGDLLPSPASRHERRTSDGARRTSDVGDIEFSASGVDRPTSDLALDESAQADDADVALPLRGGEVPSAATGDAFVDDFRFDAGDVEPSLAARGGDERFLSETAEPNEPAMAAPRFMDVADDSLPGSVPQSSSPADLVVEPTARADREEVQRDEEARPTQAAAATPPAAQRSRVLPFALVLVAGIILGVVAGYFFASMRQPGTVPATLTQPASRDAEGRAVVPGIENQASTAVPGTRNEGPGTTVTPSQHPPAAVADAVPPTSAARPAPPTSPAPPKLSAAAGRLVVRSTPRGASVSINGRSRGVTPLTVRNLAPGRYTVRVSRRGYATEERQVVLSSDRPAPTLAFSLDRASGAEPAGRVSFLGSLSVDSLPRGSQVFLDGRLVGVTPVVVPDVPVGSHVVRIDRIGFRRWSQPIQVVSGQTARVTASLERENR